jgi:UDP-N-acetylglucosamine 2-epimerase (non-hydrolysing)
LKIVTIIGTRPEIIKMSPLLELLNKHFDHTLIHSGQHYDPALDDEIFTQLQLPSPNIRLKTGSGNFPQQLFKQMNGIHKNLQSLRPSFVIVQGDTNTALSATLVATRLGIEVIHIEAGCRSFNPNAPEEQNRILIDSVSTHLLCSDKNALHNLRREKKEKKTFLVGSTTFDALKRSDKLTNSQFYKSLSLTKESYILATLHRAESMSSLDQFKEKIEYLNWVAEFKKIIFPIHPRTKKFIDKNKIKLHASISVIPPLKHLQFINLIKNSRFIISDSGGIQEEAAYFNRPCLVLRKETEWTRLIKAKKNFMITSNCVTSKNLTKKLLFNNVFYKKTRNQRCLESTTGSSKKIISLIKKISL